MRALLLPLLLLATTAHADERVTDEAPAPPAPAKTPRFAVAVNSPLSWIGGKSVGGSVYAGLTDHLAIRANVASYEATASFLAELVGAAAGGDGDEAERSGRTLDLGVGVIHYSRGLWNGFTMEAGALRRARDIRVTDEFAAAYRTSTETTTYGGRALLGWSWLVHPHAFMAVAVGGSAGIETGTETTENERGEMKTTKPVDRSDVSFEGYVRFGGAF